MLYFKEKFKYLLQKHKNIEKAWEELKAREINEQVRNGALRTQAEINHMSENMDTLFKNEIILEYCEKDQNLGGDNEKNKL